VNKNFDDILDNCINQIKLGNDDIDGCLAKYPEYSEELKSHLHTFYAIAKIPKPIPSPQFKLEAKSRLLKQAKSKKLIYLPLRGVKPRRFQSLKTALVQIAATVLIVVLLSGGVAMASANSLPNSPLYPVKIATESVQLALTLNQVTKAELHLRFAERRLEEITRTFSHENKEEIKLEKTINAMISHTNKAIALTNNMSKEKREEILLKTLNLARREQETLQKVMVQTPVEIKNAIKNAIKKAQGKDQKNNPEDNEAESLIEQDKTNKEINSKKIFGPDKDTKKNINDDQDPGDNVFSNPKSTEGEKDNGENDRYEVEGRTYELNFIK